MKVKYLFKRGANLPERLSWLVLHFCFLRQNMKLEKSRETRGNAQDYSRYTLTCAEIVAARARTCAGTRARRSGFFTAFQNETKLIVSGHS